MKQIYLLGALLIGCCIGGGAVWIYCRNAMTEVKLQSHAEFTRQKLFDTVVGLRLLRQGKTNEFFRAGEEELNLSIFLITFLKDEFPNERTNKVYNMIARYRSNYPYKSEDSQLDERVQSFLNQE